MGGFASPELAQPKATVRPSGRCGLVGRALPRHSGGERIIAAYQRSLSTAWARRRLAARCRR